MTKVKPAWRWCGQRRGHLLWLLPGPPGGTAGPDSDPAGGL